MSGLSQHGAGLDGAAAARLGLWLAGALGAAHVDVNALRPLSGGAIQENWLAELVVDGMPRSVVIRKDSPAAIPSSLGRAEEFALLQLAHRGGVTVPEPIAFCAEPDILGGPFAVMSKAEGQAFGPRLVRDEALGGDREALGRQLGHELARIHSLRPEGPAFAFLERGRSADPARSLVARLRASLDAMGLARPVTEWGLRWAELHAPPPRQITLCHHDFRTGNYMVDQSGLTAILDWEFAGYGDPMADLGWFCARCWRFSRPDREGGGVTSRAAFYAGYEQETGQPVDREAVAYWEVMAHLRWGVIALEQGERHVSGAQPSLELALTGRMIAELERGALMATAPGAWSRAPMGRDRHA